jgi:hypothetical protein
MNHRRTFLSGPAGTGKTTQAVEHLRELLQAGLQAEGILVIAPQRSLLQPYQNLLRRADLPGGDDVETLTIGGLAKRSVDLLWPAIAREAGFAHPERPPTFLTLETAQYYMERVAQPFIAERYYFEEVRLAQPRIYSQLLDSLNKAALVGFPYTEVGKRLANAWAGPSQQIITFTQVQDCLDRFRAYCLEHNLLDFSLQIELFRGLLQQAWFRDKLYGRYRHLIVDNVEEDTPLTHDVLREWIPPAASALIVYDTDAGYRSFLGADARSGEALRAVCDEIVERRESRVMSPAVQSLEATVAHVLAEGDSDLPTRSGDLHEALAYGGGRFHPQMLDWVAKQIADLVQHRQASPGEIVILAPFLSDALRFALEERLHREGVPTRSLRPSRALNEEAVTRGLLTLAALAHPRWQIVPPQADVTQAMILSIDPLDPARGHLIAERLYHARGGQTSPGSPAESRGRPGGAELRAFDNLRPELQERIGFEVGAKVDRLRSWLLDYAQAETPPPLDVFFARLFGEVLSQPGYGFHRRIDPGRITAQIVESARKFRQTVNPDPYAAALDPNVGRDYARLVSEGVVAATYVESRYAEKPEAVLLAPAYTFLLSNESVGYQFWLNAGSPAWWERLYQPLTHPYVLSRHWPPDKKWEDADEVAARQATLLRLVRGLLRRCGSRVYLAISTLNEQGFEERGPLLTLVQQVLREAA